MKRPYESALYFEEASKRNRPSCEPTVKSLHRRVGETRNRTLREDTIGIPGSRNCAQGKNGQRHDVENVERDGTKKGELKRQGKKSWIKVMRTQKPRRTTHERTKAAVPTPPCFAPTVHAVEGSQTFQVKNLI